MSQGVSASFGRTVSALTQKKLATFHKECHTPLVFDRALPHKAPIISDEEEGTRYNE